jgi:hypothetical protein
MVNQEAGSEKKKGAALRTTIRQPGSDDNVEEEEYGESNFLLGEGSSIRRPCAATQRLPLFFR